MKFNLFILLLFCASCNLLTNSEPRASEDLSSDMGISDFSELGSCSDSLINGSETDLNCGGETCRPCVDFLTCKIDRDCASGVCNSEVCSLARCDDGVVNGGESDVDCGGDCNPCADGSACVVLKDCQSNLCGDSICQSDCTGKCGGDCPTKCDVGETCAPSDCRDGLWCDGICKPIPDGWKRTISFTAIEASTDFNAYIQVPDFGDEDAETLVFEQNGEVIPSEPADDVGAYWVNLDSVVEGENRFQVARDERKSSADLKMWSEHIGVFHAPGIQPVIAETFDVREVMNITATEGRFGAASYFDGTAYAIITGLGVEALFPTFTISLWFRHPAVSNDWKPLIGRQFSTTNSDDIALGDFQSGRLWACSLGNCARSFGSVILDEWVFVTMTYDGTTMKIYLNGRPEGEAEGMRMQSISGNPLTIGGDIDNPDGVVDSFFVGAIDEIRFSSTPKTAAAILLQYSSTERSFFTFGEKEPLSK